LVDSLSFASKIRFEQNVSEECRHVLSDAAAVVAAAVLRLPHFLEVDVGGVGGVVDVGVADMSEVGRVLVVPVALATRLAYDL
jgi:hypothetical protein